MHALFSFVYVFFVQGFRSPPPPPPPPRTQFLRGTRLTEDRDFGPPDPKVGGGDRVPCDTGIFGPFSVLEKGLRLCSVFCEASNCLTKIECRLRSEVDTTLEIAQNGMQRVVLLCSYAFLADKLSPSSFLKRQFDKIALKNIRFSRNRC